MFYIFNRYHFILVLLSVLIVPCQETKSEEVVDANYREKIELQVGRNIYVTGEAIWYKAFVFSNLQNIYSKVLYVELVDAESRHILGQIVEISEGMASSSLLIPDTLTTDSYNLKVYTNWMRNFNPGHFATYSIYIFNQYDDTDDKNIRDYSLMPEPDIYIENGMLIPEATTRIKIDFQSWMSDTVKGYLIETTTDLQKDKFSIDREGIGLFTIIPIADERYRIEIEPISGRRISIELPAVESIKPAINIIKGEKGRLYIQPINLPVKTASYRLAVIKDEKSIWEKNITGSLDDSIEINLEDSSKGLLNIRLLDKANHIVADKQIYVNRNSEETHLSEQTFRTRAPVEIPINSIIDEGIDLSGLSVSIYKSVFPEIQPNEFISRSLFESRQASVAAGDKVQVLLSLYKNLIIDDKILYQSREGNPKFPVEDIGVLYSGRVVNSVNEGPLAGVEVILSVKDTIPQLLFSNTDKEGRFFYLIDDYGEKHALINLYLLGAQLSGSFKILLDNKFYYQKNLELRSEISLEQEGRIVKYLDNEAQRVLIQRAFGREDISSDSVIISGLKKPFYSDQMHIVYPSEYFDLPNFEEIAREILPRVRYKQTKTGCEITIYHMEYGIKTNSPIVLLDGLPVKDYCDLYPLKSEDINRVEIISGANISGNLFYEGVLAVYTSTLYRNMNAKNNGRFFYDVSGYHVSPEFSISDYSANDKININQADFKNQLLWDPLMKKTETSGSICFYTSDEEGTYTIDICGYTYNGQLLQVKRKFNVISE